MTPPGPIIFLLMWSTLLHRGNKGLLDLINNKESSTIRSQGLFTIQFGSLEPAVIPVTVRRPVMETNSNPTEEEERWTLVSRRRPRNPKQAQPPSLHQRKRQGRKKTPRCAKSKKKSKASKRHEVQPIDLLEQEPLIPITLEEFFPVRFFEKITVNMTSCYELENEEDGKEAKLEKPPKNDGEALTSLEALPIYDDWRQIFSLPKEMREQIVAALQHPKLYVDKVKSVG